MDFVNNSVLKTYVMYSINKFKYYITVSPGEECKSNVFGSVCLSVCLSVLARNSKTIAPFCLKECCVCVLGLVRS